MTLYECGVIVRRGCFLKGEVQTNREESDVRDTEILK
jgi:hypothetical protein